MISINSTSSLKRKLLENETNVNISGIFECRNNLTNHSSYASKHYSLAFSNDSEIKNRNFKRKKCDNISVKIDEKLHCESNCFVSETVYEEELKDSKEIFDWLDQIDIQEQSRDELNQCSPVTMDIKTLRIVLNLKRFKNSVQATYEINEPEEKQHIHTNLCNVYQEQGDENTKSLEDFQDSSTDSCEEQNLIKTVNTIDPSKKRFSDEFKTFIVKFIERNIGSCYKKNYYERIKSLEEACIIFDEFKFDQERYNSIFKAVDKEKLLLQLRNINVTFEKNLEFNQETCNKFTEEFNAKIFKSDESLRLLCLIDILPYDQKVIFFYQEIYKLYKYIVVIPEFLTLARLFSTVSCQRLIFILHLTNLFADKIGNLEENRIIILCMIYKAYKIFI
jgi:hypothetical protein